MCMLTYSFPISIISGSVVVQMNVPLYCVGGNVQIIWVMVWDFSLHDSKWC